MLKLAGIPGAIFGLCVIRPRRYLTVSVDRPNPILIPWDHKPEPLNRHSESGHAAEKTLGSGYTIYVWVIRDCRV